MSTRNQESKTRYLGPVLHQSKLPLQKGEAKHAKKIDSVATDDSEVFVPIKKRITAIGHKHPTK
jgi:hypothetical protein